MKHSTHLVADEALLDTVCQPDRVRRRRAIVTTLEERETSVSLSTLAEQVLAREADAGWGAGDGDETDLRVELYHNHLPKLADAGVVEFDPDERVVASAE